ncbi:MAG: DUF4351 domain-containing protein [Planctomycetes bacterium]|nr:DUF4351 domain-containing protein [Planctomycetota bacterium]
MQGREEGKLEGKIEGLFVLLRTRFREISPGLMKRIESIKSFEKLDSFYEAALNAKTLEDFQNQLPKENSK